MTESENQRLLIGVTICFLLSKSAFSMYSASERNPRQTNTQTDNSLSRNAQDFLDIWYKYRLTYFRGGYFFSLGIVQIGVYIQI